MLENASYTSIMVKRREARQAATDDYIADDEVSRIIQQAGLQTPAGDAKILRPSDLDELVQSQNSAKLIQLDDEDVAMASGHTEAEDYEESDTSEPGIGDELFYLLLNSICFGTLWLCLWVRSLCMDVVRLIAITETCSSMLSILKISRLRMSGDARLMSCQVRSAAVFASLTLIDAPGLIFVIFVSSRFPSNILVRIVLFCFSTIGGAHLVYIVNKATYMAGGRYTRYVAT